jgi:hypothetical protein
MEDSGAYGQQKVQYIRVYRADQTWELWRKDPKTEKWNKQKEGKHTYADGIPIRTLYLNREGFMTAKPPLMNLAWLNLAHWQSSSDQRNCLRFARVGVMFAAGFTDEQVEKGLVIGPSALIATENANAKLEYVEHSGAAIQSGERDLEKLEEQMEVLGKRPMMPGTGTQTATEKSINEGRSTSALQNWVRAAEIFWRECFEVAAKWLNTELPEKFKVNIFSEFVVGMNGSADLTELRAARNARDIDHETWVDEVKRRGLLSENVTAETIKDRLQEEGPALGDIGNGQDVPQNPGQQGKQGKRRKSGGMGGGVPRV